jgi:hypothetical protein
MLCGRTRENIRFSVLGVNRGLLFVVTLRAPIQDPLMKHAGEAALDRLDDLLSRLRKQKGLTERKRGVFYLASAAFLHFHEDPEGLFADVRTDSEWERLPVTTRVQQRELVAKIKTALRRPR